MIWKAIFRKIKSKLIDNYKPLITSTGSKINHFPIRICAKTCLSFSLQHTLKKILTNLNGVYIMSNDHKLSFLVLYKTGHMI